MFPVSGERQFIAAGPMKGERPVSSASTAYSTFDIPDTSGRKRFHKPRSRAGNQVIEHRRDPIGRSLLGQLRALAHVDGLGGNCPLVHKRPNLVEPCGSRRRNAQVHVAEPRRWPTTVERPRSRLMAAASCQRIWARIASKSICLSTIAPSLNRARMPSLMHDHRQ